MILALQVHALACIRGDRLVFREIGFSLAAGEVLALEGANGAGKTSLLRMIAGFLAPAAGTIALVPQNGQALSDRDERARFVGWLGHSDAIKPQLTVKETLQFFARLYGGGQDWEGALARVGLGPAAALPCQYLSAGQKRRLALARLSLSARPLWLLDEPLAALDAAGKALVRAMIAGHCKAGGLAVAATHEPLGLDGPRLRLGAA